MSFYSLFSFPHESTNKLPVAIYVSELCSSRVDGRVFKYIVQIQSNPFNSHVNKTFQA